ncbi:MAG: hypothetical protein U0401_14695 [Anaerolineae bacterium]
MDKCTFCVHRLDARGCPACVGTCVHWLATLAT